MTRGGDRTGPRKPGGGDRGAMIQARASRAPDPMRDPWRDATPLLLRLSACGDRDEAEAVAAALTGTLGFDYFSYVVAAFPAGDDGRGASGIYLSNYPDEWRRRYRRQAYEVEDPVIVDGKRARAPFPWRGEGETGAVTRHARQMYDEAGTFGIRNGFTVPVRGPEGDCGLFSVSGRSPPANAQDIAGPIYPALLVLAQLLHAGTMAQRSALRGRPAVDLTYHERVCLNWAARGKTAREIAVILGRSKATVDFHLRGASAKLGAANKVQAVVRALTLNLI